MTMKRPSFAVATAITHIITAANLTELRTQAMLMEVTAAMRELGDADDILKQPLPVAYTRSFRQPFLCFCVLACLLACLLALLGASFILRTCNLLAGQPPAGAHPVTAESMSGHATSLLPCRHTSRFMLAWLMALPVAIWDTYSWVTIPMTAAIAFFLLGIENIGEHMCTLLLCS